MSDPASALDDLLVLRLWRASAAFDRRLADELAHYGLTVAAFRLVGEVLRAPDGLRQGELARRLGVRPPTISNAVDRLERDGLVVRRVDPEDPRARRVHLAPDAPLTKGIDVLQRMEAALLEGLDPADHARLTPLLDHLADRMMSPMEPRS